MTAERAEQVGLIADRCDNLVHATLLPLPPKMHLEQLVASLKEIRDELRDIVIAETGDNPWE
jgi:hypothetical protein